MSIDPQKPAVRPNPARSGLLDGIARLSRMDALVQAEDTPPLARILDTRQGRQILAGLLPDVLNTYAGKNPLKKRLAGPVGRHLKKSFLEGAEAQKAGELKQLFSDRRFIQEIAGPAADMLNGLFDLIAAAMAGIEALNTNEKKRLLSELISKAFTGQTGTLITRGCRILNDIHQDDPTFFAKAAEPGFTAWIESIDFGELKTAMENAAPDTRAFVEMVNRVFWQHPTKLMLLISLLPTVGNMLTDSVDRFLNQINRISPDLFADVMMSLLNEFDAKTIAGIIDKTAELMRKLDTGSRLLGEPGSPQLPKAIQTLVNTIIEGINPSVLWKAKIAAAETRAAAGEAMAEAVYLRDPFWKTALARSPEIRNIQIRSFNRRLACLDAADDDEAFDAIAGYLNAYDIQEMGDSVNALLSIFNRVCDRKPELLPTMAEKLAGAIDGDELEKAAGHVFHSGSGSLKGVARTCLPKMVRWVCEVISATDDEYDKDAAQARQALAALVGIQEDR